MYHGEYQQAIESSEVAVQESTSGGEVGAGQGDHLQKMSKIQKFFSGLRPNKPGPGQLRL
jgi:hypothetical protein